MKYKLKEHVTDEMLKELGYRVTKSEYDVGSMCAVNDEFDIYINFDICTYPKNTILRNCGCYITKKRIKHLIEKGYVEALK